MSRTISSIRLSPCSVRFRRSNTAVAAVTVSSRHWIASVSTAPIASCDIGVAEARELLRRLLMTGERRRVGIDDSGELARMSRTVFVRCDRRSASASGRGRLSSRIIARRVSESTFKSARTGHAGIPLHPSCPVIAELQSPAGRSDLEMGPGSPIAYSGVEDTAKIG